MADQAALPFAGELFLHLAGEGRLVVDAAEADRLIAGLEHTLDLVIARLRVVRIWQETSVPLLDELPDDLAGPLVDAAFTEQLAPGQLERAVREIPKYIRALNLARRP